MATGDLRRPTRRQRKRIDAAVQRAESRTGLQVCIVLGAPADRDPHAHAESLFIEAGLSARPAVLVLVAPAQHHVEVLTAPSARARIDDGAAAAAVAIMVEAFGRGELVTGLIAGIDHLAEIAGPGSAPPGQVDIANVLDADD